MESTFFSDGWCLGVAPHHYRCYTVYAPKTRAERIGKSVLLLPHKINTPQNSSQEEILEADLKLNKALDNDIPPVLQDKNERTVA